MEEFGCFRPLWEGGNQGEGYLRECKPLVHQMKGDWHKTLHTKLLKRKSIKLLMNSATKHDSSIGTYVPTLV